jgi:hypothetical protein
MYIYWDETSSSVQTTHLLLSCRCTLAITSVYIGTRCRPQYKQFIFSSRATVLCCRRLPHLAANVSSVSGEQVSEAYIPIVPVHEVGVIHVLGNAIAIARLTYFSLYAGVRGSPSTVCFVYFYAIFSVNRLTIRMSLFALAFLLLLAVKSKWLEGE